MMQKQRLLATAKLVEEWAHARNLINGSDPKSQTLKTVSEFGELAVALYTGDKDGIKDGIGDVLVTQIIVCAQIGADFSDICDAAESIAESNVGRQQYFALCTGKIGEMADNILKSQVFEFEMNMGTFIHYLETAFTEFEFGLADCLESAYNEIKDRRGVMFNGAFIKSDDLRYPSALTELGLNPEGQV